MSARVFAVGVAAFLASPSAHAADAGRMRGDDSEWRAAASHGRHGSDARALRDAAILQVRIEHGKGASVLPRGLELQSRGRREGS